MSPPSSTGLPVSRPRCDPARPQQLVPMLPAAGLWTLESTAMETVRIVPGPSQEPGLSQALLLLSAPHPVQGLNLRYKTQTEGTAGTPQPGHSLPIHGSPDCTPRTGFLSHHPLAGVDAGWGATWPALRSFTQGRSSLFVSPIPKLWPALLLSNPPPAPQRGLWPLEGEALQ